MKESIYIYSKFAETEKNALISFFGVENEVFFHDTVPENMQFEAFKKCQYCLGNIPISWCLSAQNLKWLQLHSAGIDPYNTLVNPSFIITNLRGYFAESVAETTLAGILSFYRGLDRLHQLQIDNQWVGSIIRPTLLKLHRKNVWVLGGGSIANTFINLIQPFDCTITQSTLRELKMNAHSIEYFQKNTENTDIIVLILPEIPELVHYFDKEKISLINAKTLIVNTGRGSTVDIEELKQALVEKRLIGAVLDVTEMEPIPKEDTLWGLPNVILTQHSAGGWEGENEGKVTFFIKNYLNFKDGLPLENIVDCERGY